MSKWRVEKSRMYPHFMCPWETIGPGGQYLVWISWGEAMKHVNDKIMEKKSD